MRIHNKSTIAQYAATYPTASEELAIWYKQVEAADWKDFNALREDMPATDYIKNDRYVFNIKGNHFRLIAMVFFGPRRVYLRGFFNHRDYTKLLKDPLKLPNL